MMPRSRLILAAASAILGAPAMAAENPVRYPDGAKVFADNCAVCHGPTGQGQAGLAPPLTVNPGRYLASADGRRQLADTALYGMFGQITVGGQKFDFKMPDFGQLDDVGLAAVLNYVAFDVAKASDGTPIAASDLADARRTPLTGEQVRNQRDKLIAALGL
jgi:mono/diheme cytochrome c family protein